jgi:hypothetical protein
MAQFGFFDSCAAESSEPHASHVGETSAQGRKENGANTPSACRALSVFGIDLSEAGSPFRECTLNRFPAAKQSTQLADSDLSELVKTSSYS